MNPPKAQPVPVRADTDPQSRPAVRWKRAPESEPGVKHRILEAARGLALAEGYEAVTMIDIAQRAGIGRATLYRYYRTKEHLFADLTVAWSEEHIGRLRAKRFSSRKVGARVTQMLRLTIEEALKHPQLVAGEIASLISDDPGVRTSYHRIDSLMPTLLRLSMGMISSRQQELAARVLQYTMSYNLILWHSGKTGPEQMLKELVLVAKIILADVWDDAVI